MSTPPTAVVPFRDADQIERLVRHFERCTLPRAEWNHRAHLAVAMWYLVHHDEGAATDRMITGIRRYNHAKGIPRTRRGGYHETLTLFWLCVGQRLHARGSGQTTVELVNAFLAMPKELPWRCYSDDLLASCEARTRWVEPDVQSIDAMLAPLLDAAELRERDSPGVER